MMNAALSAWSRVLHPARASLRPDTRLLVWRNGNIGDHIAALGVYHAIRDALPRATLVLFTSAGGESGFGRELLERDGCFAEIVAPPLGWTRQRGSVSRLRALRCDEAIYLPSDKAGLRQLAWHALLLRLAGTRALGIFRVSKLRLFRRWQVRQGLRPSEAERLEEVLGGLKQLRLAVGEPSFPVSPRQISLPQPVVAICPGANVLVNRWPSERYVELSRRMVLDGWSILVLGGAEVQPIGTAMEACVPSGRIVNAAGRTSLLEAAQLMASCRCVVSNDTGLGHLAAAVGVPVVTILSSRDLPGSWLPHGANLGVRHSVECEVCYRRECPTIHCIRGIEVDDVLRGVAGLLKSPQRGLMAV
jgi:ADP-heptose:LPS heptosyltransferase